MQNSVNASARIEPIRKRLVTEQIIERLIPAIATGSFPPGHRLVEDELASELGVSRVPVREAIRELSLQGILCSASGRGWRIAPFDDRQIREVCSVRIALETMMLTEAIQAFRSDPAHFAPLDSAIEDMERAAAEFDADKLRCADVSFHRSAISVAGNLLGQSIWEGISRQVTIIFGLEIYSDPDFAAVIKQHQTLRNFLAEGNPARLGAVLREHITGRNLRTALSPNPTNQPENRRKR